MRSVKLVAVVTLLAAGSVFAQSTITYSIETGGNNNTYSWEAKAAPQPFFTRGVKDGSTTVKQGDDLTWAVGVAVSGTHTGGGPGSGKDTFGAANLVFDLQLFLADGTTLVTGFGAAPLTCSSGTPGVAGAKVCKPSDKGFWSSINDGDSDNPNNPSNQVLDTLANAAFAWGIYATAYLPPAPGATLYRLIDAAGADPLNAPQGPNFDYGWYPTSNGRGGVDTEGSKPINTGVTTVNSALVGFGAGYKSYDATSHRAGVGLDDLGIDYGYGADGVVFEGQLNTLNLALGTYVLKVVPSADGNNVIHGDVSWDSATPNYGGAGSFAVKANAVAGSQVSFTVIPGAPTIAGRALFYNQSYYDGNKGAIDAAPLAGANNDDADAIATNKTALLPGGGTATFANWTSFDKGINGLIYDIKDVPAGHTMALSDFEFVNQGKQGTATTVISTGITLATQANTPVAGTTRCIFTFTNGSVKNCWLKVTCKTSIGLTAADVSYWGNAVADSGTGNTPPYIQVTGTDEIYARSNPVVPPAKAPITHAGDYNRDGIVTGTDQIIARTNVVPLPSNSVRMIVR